MRLLSVFLLAALAAAPIATAAAAERPNVVLVITDDQGYGDLGCHGHPIVKTPHLDALHAESTRFTDFHVSPTCSPTRGALMSGHHTNRSGAWHTIMARSILFEDETTLGEAFAAGGYATGMFGKWHLGDNYPFRPEDRGFQQVVRHGGGGIGQTPDVWNNAYFNDRYTVNDRIEQRDGYCTDVFFNETRKFIEQSVAEGKPFFAYVSTNAPHGPLLCPEKYFAPYLDKVDRDEQAFVLGMITNIDDNVGRLREYLDHEGLAENTIFIFMTDNGAADENASVFNARMRGIKGSEYEGGHRVPFFVHWPAGGINKPTDIGTLAAHIDVLPTLQELCGLPVDPGYQLDGRSLAPLLKNPKAEWPERVIVTDSQRLRTPEKWRKSATMTERWRLVNGQELYDIVADPSQTHDIAAEHPQVVARLRDAYTAWWNDLAPSFDRQARIVLGNPAENPSRLTCHDWLTNDGSTPWHQGQVREGLAGAGEWAVHVERAGRYRITLRRWPAEAAAPLASGLPAGADVPGAKPYRATVGDALPIVSAGVKIAGFEQEKRAESGAESVAFDVDLEAGPTSLTAHFGLADGKQVGAYYADVEWLE